MSASYKLWCLTTPKDSDPIALTETWDMAQIIAKRLHLQEFSIDQVKVTVSPIPKEQLFEPVEKDF